MSAAEHAHPQVLLQDGHRHRVNLVLQALLIWQLLNENAALAEGGSDARFTRLFMVVTPGLSRVRATVRTPFAGSW